MATDNSAVVPSKFLSDEAIGTTDKDSFGIHSAYARVLYEIAKASYTPFTVALYGGWGAGKTTICRLLKQLSAEDPSIRHVYLDVWKYSSDPLKRWVLLETVRTLEEQGALTNYTLEGRSLKSHLEFEESWEDHGKVKVNLNAVRSLGIAVVAVILCFFALLYFSSGPRNSLRA
jgi:hypothetical protein